MIIVGGFFFTLLSTAYSVVAVRSLQGSLITEFPTVSENGGNSAAKPFSDEMAKTLAIVATVSGLVAVAPIQAISKSPLITPLTNISFLSGTLAAFVWGARLPQSVTKIFHPLVTSAIAALIQAKVMGLLVGKSLPDMVNIYRSTSFAWNKVGAGDLLLFALGPAVFSLAIAMYSRKDLMAENLLVILTGTIVAGAGGLFR